jgi:DNA-binding GntR family transcriptional regulator
MQARNEQGTLSSLSTFDPPEQSLENRALDALMVWLTSRDTPPGAPVPVREFAEQLGMSRTPLRTALGRLYQQGLVDYHAQRGFTVSVPTAKELNELFDVRLMVERQAIGALVDRGNPPAVGALRAQADAMTRMVNDVVARQDAYKSFRLADTVFHQAIVDAAQNQRLSALYRELHLEIHVTRFGWQRDWRTDRFADAANEHEAIVSALELGDRVEALTRLDQHINRVRRTILDGDQTR